MTQTGRWGHTLHRKERTHQLDTTRKIEVAILAVFSLAAHGQTPLETLESLELESARIGHVTAHFATDDRHRAEHFAQLAGAAATYFEREFGLKFDLRVAALSPENWFSEFPHIPYAMPWPSIPDKIIFMPSSLTEGLLVRGQNELAVRQRIDFVLLHELGHIAAKEYFRQTSDEDYLPIQWLDELIATYFAYAYVAYADPVWAATAVHEWQREVDGFSPTVLSLDWSYMNELPGGAVARDYGWYQIRLNLWAAQLYSEHGLDLLREIKQELPWESAESWKPAALLPLLDDIAAGFQETVNELGGY